ncbi:MAG TPA: PAS domain S-box protein, partial [bacterium (Candidatus Stahlbacteria)]|nr:PAS domain S-box protein [Candidatus Stahlbacteria bacterium]
MIEDIERDKIIHELRELKDTLNEGEDLPGYPPPRRNTNQEGNVYEELFNLISDVVYTVALDGTITSLNPAFERITGWKTSEWIGKNFKGLFHPDDVKGASGTFRNILKGKKPEINR